jgi:hypothetical protein
MTDTNTNETAETTQQPSQQQGADLNVSDLNAIKSIIDVATQRGAFRAPELESVGKIYNKLSNFLDSITKKDQ